MSCTVTRLSGSDYATAILQCETTKIAKENRDRHDDRIVTFRSEEKFAWTHRRVIRFAPRLRHSVLSFRRGVSRIPELDLENSFKLPQLRRPRKNSAMPVKCTFSPECVRQ